MGRRVEACGARPGAHEWPLRSRRIQRTRAEHALSSIGEPRVWARRALGVGRAGARGSPRGQRVTHSSNRTLKRDLKLRTYLKTSWGKCSERPFRPKPKDDSGFRKPSAGGRGGAAPSWRSACGRRGSGPAAEQP